MTDYAALLRELAIPRLVGTPNHQTVREVLKRELAARGFSVEEHAFSGRPARALMGAPTEIRGVNLIATRIAQPPNRPTAWLVAHYDSKGQPISMALRLVGVVLLAAGIVLLLIKLFPALVLLALGIAVFSQNRATDNSPGAVDNASAMVTVFMTLDLLRGRRGAGGAGGADVGVIFPDAEELGLVGAKALVTERADLLAGAAIVNLDGIDDDGRPVAFVHRSGPVAKKVSRALGARTWRWLPVVVDGIALRRASGECVTIMKGGWHTMRRVHTPEDSADRLTLAGATGVAEGLARSLSEP